MEVKPLIRLSHSAFETLHTCERKFQLERLLDSGFEREDSPASVGGKCFGAGVQEYLLSQDKEKALFKAWLAYWPQLEDSKRSQAKYINALEQSFATLDQLLMDYELATFEGKEAIELSFRLNTESNYYYVGYIDAVLRHRRTGRYAVFEIKTTALALHDITPNYKNSGQALGYSVVLDRIAGEQNTQYDLLYFVCQMGKGYENKYHVLPFKKTLLDRLNWFLTLGLDIQRLEQMEELGIYPKRGGNCLQYMRPCPHFNTCSLHSFDKPKEIEPDEIEYQFVYALDDLVSDHLVRVNENRDYIAEQELEIAKSETPVLEEAMATATSMASLEELLDAPVGSSISTGDSIESGKPETVISTEIESQEDAFDREFWALVESDPFKALDSL